MTRPAEITHLADARLKAAAQLDTARRRHTTTAPILRRIARLTHDLLAAELTAPPRRKRAKPTRTSRQAADPVAPSLL